jgi:hypothetical protein
LGASGTLKSPDRAPSVDRFIGTLKKTGFRANIRDPELFNSQLFFTSVISFGWMENLGSGLELPSFPRLSFRLFGASDGLIDT